MMSRKIGITLAAILVVIGLAACSRTENPDLFRDRSSSPDSDHDTIPDLIETRLGLNPLVIDSDTDGLTDHYELWGCRGAPIGQIDALENLPDPNGNGLNAARDRHDAGERALTARESSAIGTARIPVPQYTSSSAPTALDPDGDLITSEYELAGFYVNYDPSDGQLYFVKWDGSDQTQLYYKTDPLKWSTDADPWSDYEEATKVNLDQRIKKPGDHPLIPAYPDIQVILRDFSWESAATIEDQQGGSQTEEQNLTAKVGFKISATAEAEVETGKNIAAKTKKSVTAEVSGEVSASLTQSTEFNWNTATTSDTIKAARLTLNVALVNVGTLPATNPKVVCNLRLGDFAISTFAIAYNGEMQAMSPQPVEMAVLDNGAADPQELFLSLNQLRSLMQGARIGIEVVGFEADTLVSEFDTSTGRRINLDLGPWSPYQSAIQNNSARVIVNLDEAGATLVGSHALPPRRLVDARVFAYPSDGTYFGSPPVITLRDSLRWLCDARPALNSTYITVFDVISGEKLVADLFNWSIAMGDEDYELVQRTPALQADLLSLPLQPSNPLERAYICSAPLRGEGLGTKAQWALLFAKGTQIFASIENPRREIDVVLFPYPGANGIPLQPPDSQARAPGEEDRRWLYHAVLPSGYIWSGHEQLTVTDSAGAAVDIPVELYRSEVLPGPGLGQAEGPQPPHSLDLDSKHDSESSVPDLRVSRPLGPYEYVRAEALNGATLTGILSPYITQVDYALLRKASYGLEELSLPSRIGAPFTSPFYLGRWVFGLRTSEGRLVRLVFEDLADENSAGKTVRFTWLTHEGV
jgi:hypothetical protein